MKNILYTICAVLLLASCNEKGGDDTNLPLEKRVCGEWHSTSLPIDADIYLSLSEDASFELYQQIGEGLYRLYRGEWNIENDILSGKYNDGEPWASSYQVEIVDGTLTLTSYNDAAEESAFRKEAIPAEVRDNCVVEVKSVGPVL